MLGDNFDLVFFGDDNSGDDDTSGDKLKNGDWFWQEKNRGRDCKSWLKVGKERGFASFNLILAIEIESKPKYRPRDGHIEDGE